MRAAPIKAVRRAMRERQGEMRDIPLERMRHAMRRTCKALEREERETWH